MEDISSITDNNMFLSQAAEEMERNIPAPDSVPLSQNCVKTEINGMNLV